MKSTFTCNKLHFFQFKILFSKLNFKVLKTVKSTTQLQLLILCPLPSAQYPLDISNISAKVTCLVLTFVHTFNYLGGLDQGNQIWLPWPRQQFVIKLLCRHQNIMVIIIFFLFCPSRFLRFATSIESIKFRLKNWKCWFYIE